VRNPLLCAGPAKWWGDPLAWVELFALANIAFMALDVALAHTVNAFANPVEWVPVVFSLLGPVVLAVAAVSGGLRPTPSAIEAGGEGAGRRRAARRLGLAVGWASVAVGVAGLLFHLDSAFFGEQTLKNLVYTAPFAAPLAYAGLGLLLILDRMVDSRSAEWGRWVVLLALGGFAGNFALSLADHAQNGFFSPAEWVPVVAGAFAVGSLVAVLAVDVNRPFIWLCVGVMATQVAVGLLGFFEHARADLAPTIKALWENIVYGAPVFAPLLFADLALLACLGLWAMARQSTRTQGGQVQQPVQ
jgi:hypothetical protein